MTHTLARGGAQARARRAATRTWRSRRATVSGSKGWFVPSRNGATVIAFPGRSGPQKQTRMLVRHGYGVLLFDRRGEGASEGDPNIFGWVGDRDLHAAAAYPSAAVRTSTRSGSARIGLSVGGEMLIHAAAHSDAFKAIVSEGASGQSVRDGLANTALPDAILGDGAVHAGDRSLHEHAAAAEPEERGRRRSRRPPSSSSTARRGRAARRRSRTRASTRPPASRSRSGRSRTASTSPASPPSRRSTSAASSASSTKPPRAEGADDR